jgi:hypothetical protein
MQPTGASQFPTIHEALQNRIADAIAERDDATFEIKLAAIVRITVRLAHGA